MANFLIVYASRYGQTAKIAEALANELARLGHDAWASDIGDVPEARGFDGVVLGAPVYQKRFPNEVRRWIETHRSALAGRPTAFFSVCLHVLESPRAAEEHISRFLHAVHWQPNLATTFGGALAYTRYGRITRTLMKLVLRRMKGDVDTDRDYEYTDWEAVRSFARQFEKLHSESTRPSRKRAG